MGSTLSVEREFPDALRCLFCMFLKELQDNVYFLIKSVHSAMSNKHLRNQQKLSRSAVEPRSRRAWCLLRNALSPSSEPVTHTRPHSLPALVTSHPCAHWPSAEFYSNCQKAKQKERRKRFWLNFKRERFLILFWNLKRKLTIWRCRLPWRLNELRWDHVIIFSWRRWCFRWTALPNCQKTPLKLPEEPCSPLLPAEPRSSTTGTSSSTSSILQLQR